MSHVPSKIGNAIIKTVYDESRQYSTLYNTNITYILYTYSVIPLTIVFQLEHLLSREINYHSASHSHHTPLLLTLSPSSLASSPSLYSSTSSSLLISHCVASHCMQEEGESNLSAPSRCVGRGQRKTSQLVSGDERQIRGRGQSCPGQIVHIHPRCRKTTPVLFPWK